MTGGTQTLVTGASGFIGQHCVRYLAARGWQVTALDISSVALERARNAAADAGAAQRIDWRQEGVS